MHRITATAGLVVALIAPLVGADNAVDNQILEDGRRLIEEAKKQPTPDWLKGNKYDNEARRIAESMRGLLQPPSSSMPEKAKDPLAGKPHYLIYISHSMGEQAIQTIMDDVAGRKDVMLVFRGIRPGQGLGQGIREIHAMVRGYEAEEIPNVIIDPTKFKRDAVTAVPVMVYRENSETVLSVTGNSNIHWLEDKQRAGYTGDLGAYGPTKEILEPDLIELMKERVAQINWEEKKKAARERFWTKQTYYPLPVAQEYRERMIDPTVVARRDIKNHKGDILVFKGQRFNPMDQMPFNQLLVVFNGRDKDQVRKAKELRANTTEFQRVTMITTEVDGSRGWDHMAEMERELDSAVYLLTPELLQRFHIERVPTTVTGKDKHFFVVEHPVKERIGDQAAALSATGGIK